MSTNKIQILTNAYHDYSNIHGNKTQLKARKINQKDYNTIPVIFNEIQNGFNLQPVKIKSFRLVKYFKSLGFTVKFKGLSFIVSL